MIDLDKAIGFFGLLLALGFGMLWYRDRHDLTRAIEVAGTSVALAERCDTTHRSFLRGLSFSPPDTIRGLMGPKAN